MKSWEHRGGSLSLSLESVSGKCNRRYNSSAIFVPKVRLQNPAGRQFYSREAIYILPHDESTTWLLSIQQFSHSLCGTVPQRFTSASSKKPLMELTNPWSDSQRESLTILVSISSYQQNRTRKVSHKVVTRVHHLISVHILGRTVW